MKKILVSGATGFLGSHLIERLAACGENVIAVSRCPVPDQFAMCNNIMWLERDISSESIDSDELLGVETIVHLAGATLGAKGNEWDFLRANEGTIVRLLQSCGLQAKRVVFASSQVVYGDANHTSVSEATPVCVKPKTAYACSKINSENWLRWFQGRNGGLYLSLRFSGFIEGGGAIDYIIDRALENGTIELYSQGCVCRDYLPIEKGTDALISAIHYQGADGFNVFNIGSGQTVSLLELSKHICDEVNSSSKIVLSDHPAPQGDFVFNLTKAIKHLDFIPDDLISSVRAYARQKFSARLTDA